MERRPEARQLARELRRQGQSLGEIAARVGAAKSSVSLWVRDIPLAEAQQAALDERNPVKLGKRIGNYAWSRQNRERRLQAQAHGRELARSGNALHQAGCMLYWAEGAKSRNCVAFTNSDADMHTFFLRFLRECYGVQDAQVQFCVNCFLGNGLSLEEIEDWWLERLDLPRSCVRKATVNTASRASKGVRPQLLHGTARLQVSSTFIVQSIYGAIQEYAGCERPEWLDLGVRLPPAAPG